MRIYLILSLLLAAVQPAVARSIHVDNVRGDDRFTGMRSDTLVEWSGPVHSLAKALRLAVGGDRIVVAPTGVPYREMLSLVGERHSGTDLRPFVIDGGGAILDGSAEVDSRAWEHFQGDVFRFRPGRLGSQQLFVAGRPLRNHPLEGANWRIPQLEPLEWVLLLGHIYVRTQPRHDPASYQMSYAVGQTGITLYQVRDVVIANLIVQGFQIDGINAHTSAMDVRLSGVTCRGNGRSGVSVGGASRVLVDRCLIGDNGRAQLRSESFGQTRVVESQLLENTAAGYVIEGGRLWIDGAEIKPPRR